MSMSQGINFVVRWIYYELSKNCFHRSWFDSFMKNIVGDVLQWEALKGAHFSLMDINEQRLLESEMVLKNL